MNVDGPDASDLLADLAEKYTRRLRNGERPSIEEYAQSHPHLAERIRRILRTLTELEVGQPDVVRAPAPPPAQPERIGGYRILRELGRGGMGVVYEAEQAVLCRRVALKVLARRLADPASVERFRREAAAAAQLHHGNVVPVFEAGQDGDVCFFAMQLIEGRSLTQFIAAQQAPGEASPFGAGQSTLSPEEAARQQPAQATEFAATPAPPQARMGHRERAGLILQAARGLAYAHSKGMVHRDVKPGNLLLDHAGVVWVSDFGLVKLEDSALTQTGSIVGTLRYLAPEQMRGQCDRRSDVYSLGLTLYELLTLKSAFTGDTQQILEAIRTREPVPPRRVDPTIPRDLETVVLKATAKDPAARYQGADELAEDLRRFLAGEPILARPPGPLERVVKWARRDPVVASLTAAVLAALLLGLGFSLAFAYRAEREAGRANDKAGEADRSARLARESEAQTKAALALVSQERDAKSKALRRAEGLRLITQSEAVRDRDPALALLLAVEGARRAPGLASNAALQEALEECSERRTLVGHKGPVLNATFSADGRKVLTCSEDATARLWDAATGKQLLSIDAANVQQAHLSPDGRRIVALCGSPMYRRSMLGAVNNAWLDWEALLPTVRLYDAESGKLVADWHPPHAEKASQVYWAAGASFSADGRHVVTFFGLYPGGEATVHDARTGRRLAVLDGATPVLAAAFSPTEATIAVACADDSVCLYEAATGRRLHTLKGHRCNVGALAFSGDGKRLLTLGTGKKYACRNVLSYLDDHPDDAAARVWDVASGKLLAALEWPDAGRLPFLAGRFTPDSHYVALADCVRGRRLFDGNSGKPGPALEPSRIGFPTSPTQGLVVLGPDSTSALYAGSDRVPRLMFGSELISYRGHMDRVDSVAFRADGKEFVTASVDGTARIWTAPTFGVSNPAPGMDYWVTPWSMLSQQGGGRLFVRQVNAAGGLLIDPSTGKELARTDAYLWDALMTDDGRKVVTLASKGPFGDQPRAALVLDVATGTFASTLADAPGRLAAVSPDGRLVLLDHRDPTRPHLKADRGTVWDLIDSKKLSEVEMPAEGTTEATFSPDGKRLLLGWMTPGGLPAPVRRVHDVATGKELYRLGGGVQNLTWAAFTDGGTQVVGFYVADALFRTFDASNGKPRHDFTERTIRPSEIRTFAFPIPRLRLLSLDPDAKRLLFSPYRDLIAVWAVAAGGEPILKLTGHSGEVTFCAWSRDGKAMLSGGDDRTCRLWNAQGEQTAVFAGHDAAVTGAALDATGQRLVTAAQDGTVRVWDVQSRQETARLRWRHHGIEGVAFSADGSRVCVRGRIVTRLWVLDALAMARERLPRSLTPAERERYEVPEQ